ncbi:hypothetical protein IAE22_31605, partial [Bacillus sp. S34]|nr:hypothetical protein [Bacillus sp. S34]
YELSGVLDTLKTEASPGSVQAVAITGKEYCFAAGADLSQAAAVPSFRSRMRSQSRSTSSMWCVTRITVAPSIEGQPEMSNPSDCRTKIGNTSSVNRSGVAVGNQVITIRMTSMVEDLLLLARLDEGREIQFDDVDLTGLVFD